MAIPGFLFLTGSPRTGTTFLMNWLGDAFPVEKVWLRESGAPSLAHRLMGALEYERRGHRWGFDLVRDKVVRSEAVEHVRALILGIYKSYGWNDGMWIVEKEPYFGPDGGAFIAHLREVFPEIKIVCLLRNHRSVLSSMLRRSWGRGPFPAPNRISPFCLEATVLENCVSDQGPGGAENPILARSLPWSLEKCCASYRNSIHMACELAGSAFFLNYEDLEMKEAVRKGLSRFAGVELLTGYEIKAPSAPFDFTAEQESLIERELALTGTLEKYERLRSGAAASLE